MCEALGKRKNLHANDHPFWHIYDHWTGSDDQVRADPLCETHTHWQSSFWVYRSPRSPKIRNVEDSSYVSSPFNHAFKEPKIQVRADPLCVTHTHRQSARFEQPSSMSYVKDDGISRLHLSLSMMLSLCRTQFSLSLSVTKFAEDKERGRFVLCFKPFRLCFQGADDPSLCGFQMWDSHT